MSRNGRVEFDWADGTHAFRLGIAEIEELQEKTGAGPYEVLRRLNAGIWRVAEVRETIRLGLIGGGMTPAEARKMVDRYAGDGQLLEATMPAMVVLNAALVGAPDEPVGKAEAAREAETTDSQTGASPSPPSMEPVQS